MVILNITINITSSDGSSITVNKDKKPRFYKRPWFWVFLAFVVSVLVKILSNNEKKILDEISQDEILTVDNDKPSMRFNSKALVKNKQPIEEVTANTQNNTLNTDKLKNFKFTVNTATKRYHTKLCGAAGKLTNEKRGEVEIEANSIDEAKQLLEQQGYTICGLCKR